MNRIKKWRNKPGSRTSMLGLVGFLVMAINLWVSHVFNLSASAPINNIFIMVIFTIWGFSGLVMAKEKVYPGFENSRWAFPVFTGIVMMLGCWAVALYAFWRMIIVLFISSTP